MASKLRLYSRLFATLKTATLEYGERTGVTKVYVDDIFVTFDDIKS